MTYQTPQELPEVDAVTAEETASGMTDEQLCNAWNAVHDIENLTDLEVAIQSEFGRRNMQV